MLSGKMVEEINEQIKEELLSGYLYLSMATDLESKTFDGFAKWMNIQAREEFGHAMRFVKYMIDMGAKVEYDTIAKPQNSWNSVDEIFKDTLEHEKRITSRIDKLMNLAVSESDYASMEMLRWFVNEQVEEEANASQWLEKIKMIGEHGTGIFQLDELAAKRDKK
jgi:ferritin